MKSSRATRARRRSERLRLYVARAVLFAVIVGGWEAAARTRLIDPYFVSLPSKLGRTVVGWFASGFIYPHIWATIHEAVVGGWPSASSAASSSACCSRSRRSCPASSTPSS
jgi:sulfonate transport system permease protein